MKKFEVLDHTADVGIRAFGKTLEEVFKNAALGMFSIVCGNLNAVACKECIEIKVEAEDKESLLVEWLNELLYLFEVEKVIFRKFDIIELREKDLNAKACGEKIDLRRHRIEAQIKACTYHRLKVVRNKNWQARVILDV